MSFKVLVTGGAGFVGSHLVDRLVNDGHDVTVIDNLDPQVHKARPSYLNTKARYVEADVRNPDTLDPLVGESDAVFHLAAAVGVGQSMYQVTRYASVNVMGTARLLEALADGDHHVRKLVVASSMSIYGEGRYECPKCGVDVHPDLRSEQRLGLRMWEHQCPCCGHDALPRPTDESKPLAPTSVYAVTKRDQEEMCLTVGRAYGIPTVALRYFNIYGPRQSLDNPYTGVCAIFSSRIKNNNAPLIYEDGAQMRDFVNVKDIVQANLLALHKPGMDYGTFNVGTGKPTSILDVANVLIKLYGSEVKPTIIGGYREGDIRHCYADIKRIKKHGYKPTVSLTDGMRELVEWGEKTSAEDTVDQAQRILKEKGLVK